MEINLKQVIDFLKSMSSNPAIEQTITLLENYELLAIIRPIIFAVIQSPDPSKLQAVRITKHLFNISLKEAKDIIDLVWSAPIPKLIQIGEFYFPYNPAMEVYLRKTNTPYTLKFETKN